MGNRNAEEGTSGGEAIAVSIGAAAKLLGISRTHAYRMATAGTLPGAYRLGGRLLVHVETLRRETARMAEVQGGVHATA